MGTVSSISTSGQSTNSDPNEALARPKRAASAEIFLDKVFPMLHQAVGSRKWAQFEPAFAHMNAQCMACHGREEHGFVVIPPVPATAHSPVLNLK